MSLNVPKDITAKKVMENVYKNVLRGIMDTKTIKPVELLVKTHHVKLVTIPQTFVLNVMHKSFFMKEPVGISVHCHY